MKILPLLLIIAVVCESYEGQCKFPKTNDHFSLKRFSGFWYYAAFDSLVPRETALYENTTCAVTFFHFDRGNTIRQKWDEDFLLRNSIQTQLKGFYYLPDPSQGLITLIDQNGNFSYDLSVLCTDYVTYAAIYACGQNNSTVTSEFIILTVRDISEYDYVISHKRVQRCFASVTDIAVKDITRRPYTNCPA